MQFRIHTLSAVFVFWTVLGALAQAPANTAVIAISGDPGHLNPAISTAGPLHAVADSMFNGLIALGRDGKVGPDLAASWSISEDGLEVRFELASGVRWHDGQPFGAADVKFTFEEVLFKYHARTRAGLAPAVAEALLRGVVFKVCVRARAGYAGAAARGRASPLDPPRCTCAAADCAHGECAGARAGGGRRAVRAEERAGG